MKLVWETGELSWTLHRAVPGALTYETGTDKIPAFTLLEASSFSDTLYFKSALNFLQLFGEKWCRSAVIPASLP